MDLQSLNSYFDKISDQILEEDEIVTYKSLGRKLGLHVNTSKQLLSSYLTLQQRQKCSPISATYLIAGKLLDGSFQIKVVNDVDLKETYSNFLEITSEHVYSIQKGKQVKHINMLNNIFGENTRTGSVISCLNGVCKPVEPKKTVEVEDKSKILKTAFLSQENTVAETNKVQTSEKKSPNKKISPKKNKEVKKLETPVTNLFAKAAKKNVKALQTIKDEKNVETNEENKKNKEESEKIIQSSASQESKKKKLTKGNKRKRIQTLSDSEESQSNDDASSIVSSGDEEKPSSIGSNVEDKTENISSTAHNKRKKRKVIDKTVMNEDGYLETKKQVVFETDSENESKKANETTGKKEEKPKAEKAVKQPSGTSKKQSSLLNFFKKT